MKQKNEELLFKDLCSRLPYGVICKCKKYKHFLFNSSHISLIESEEIKPYLFPLSSITEEQKEELQLEHEKDVRTMANCLKKCSEGDTSLRGKNILYHAVDWCNKNHFDYRGLIEKGLAIDATNLNIY